MHLSVAVGLECLLGVSVAERIECLDRASVAVSWECLNVESVAENGECLMELSVFFPLLSTKAIDLSLPHFLGWLYARGQIQRRDFDVRADFRGDSSRSHGTGQ